MGIAITVEEEERSRWSRGGVDRGGGGVDCGGVVD